MGEVSLKPVFENYSFTTEPRFYFSAKDALFGSEFYLRIECQIDRQID
ncbi:Uncharacterised protein [BD1-7 clade bacterium]|uniref:Uncharacterized protein n=1 Tax=BD1-7 clade bacterium TaxID=2029982 RepID=A0A5S9P5X5_9GAMM|nr:Uncharacterised protein [BD1-7 clade bacterium]